MTTSSKPDGATSATTRCCSLLLPLAALLSATWVESARCGTYFTEPTSGGRVSGYQIELPVSADERRSFAIPADCRDVERRLERGLSHRGGIVDRRLWRKVVEDCWFHRFLNRHPTTSIRDFVSDYDFMNARLEDLPIDADCADTASTSTQACQPSATDAHGLLRYFPAGEPWDPATSTTPARCVLRNGLFYGRLFVEADGLRCDAGHGNPSLRLIAVDFADVNGDRVLDAVLRFVPIGPHAARRPLILPLTRTSGQTRFTTIPRPSALLRDLLEHPQHDP